jgi:hypothetical protein
VCVCVCVWRVYVRESEFVCVCVRPQVNVWVDPPQIFRMLFPKPLMLETGQSDAHLFVCVPLRFRRFVHLGTNPWPTDC